MRPYQLAARIWVCRRWEELKLDEIESVDFQADGKTWETVITLTNGVVCYQQFDSMPQAIQGIMECANEANDDVFR